MPISVPSPEVNPTQLPDVRDQAQASAETFGGGAGLEAVDAASQKVSSNAAEIAIFQKIKADQVATTDATSQLSSATQDILTNQKDGVLNLQGKNAMNAPNVASEKFRKAASDIAANLHTEDQKGMFARVTQNMSKEMDRSVQAHVSKQIEKYDDESTESLIKTSQDAAARSYGDITTIGTNAERIRIGVAQYADRHGMPDDWKKEKTLEAVSTLHEGVIERMLGDGQDQMAVKYLEANKDDIDTKVLHALGPMMKEGTLRGAGQRNADKLWSNADGDFGKAMQGARDIENSDVRQRTEQELRLRQEDQQRSLKASQENAFQNGWKTVVKSGATNPAAIDTLISPTQKIQMGPEHYKALLRANMDEPTDAEAWAKWQETARDPDELAKLSPSQVQVALQDFNKQDRAKEISRWEAASKGIDKAVIPAKEFDRAAAQVIPGYKPSKLTGNAAVAAKSLHDDITAELLNWQKTTGKQANPEERQQVIDKAILDRTFKPEARLFGLYQPASKLITMKDIPQDAIAGISQLRTAKGLPLTNDQTERYYVARKRGNNKAAAAILKE